jgi:hypothetical protein
LDKDFIFANQVVKENMKQQVTEPEALWTTHYRMNEDQSLYMPKIDETHLLIFDGPSHRKQNALLI